MVQRPAGVYAQLDLQVPWASSAAMTIDPLSTLIDCAAARTVLSWQPRLNAGSGGTVSSARSPGLSPTVTGVLADAIALADGPKRVITLSDPAAADFGVTLSEPTPDRAPGALDETMPLLAEGRLRLRAHGSVPMRHAAEAHRQLESGTVHERIILTLP